MKLLELQRQMAADVMNPLTSSGNLARQTSAAYIKPNDRLTSRERLEIYNRQYWYRVIDSMYEDFAGLRAVMGQRAFDLVVRAYLTECPSRSFTLRDLGSRLEEWLRCNPAFAGPKLALALDMVRLEWAHIEAFDGKSEKALGPEDLLELGPDLRLALQPYIRLLALHYPVDDLRLRVNAAAQEHGAASNAVLRHKERGIVRRVARLKPETLFLAVHRLNYTVYYRRITPEEFRLLTALGEGRPIGEAIDASFEDSPLPVSELQRTLQTWFANWAELGWLCKADKK